MVDSKRTTKKGCLKMRAAIVFLLATLSSVATPAAVEWTWVAESPFGYQYFIDFSTLKKGARPKAWFLTNYSARNEFGDLSSKTLNEADCGEVKIRTIASRHYKEPDGTGTPSSVNYQPREWGFVTPNTPLEVMVRVLCQSNR